MLPNLIIIGAMKCGTTSLHYYLSLHRQIHMSREKELNFFLKRANWSRGIDWYASHFQTDKKIRGETSPNYSNYPNMPGVPERMSTVTPDVKLIYLVRDPLDRILSQYVHHYAAKNERRTLSVALKDLTDKNPYLSRSRYHMQIERYLNLFPASSILILDADELNTKRKETLQTVFRFLEVDDEIDHAAGVLMRRKMHQTYLKRHKNRIGRFLEPIIESQIIQRLPKNARAHASLAIYFPFSRKIARPVLDDDLRCRLIDALQDDIDKFRKLTGREFEAWSL